VLKDFDPNVLATFPAPCKAYPAGLPVVEPPRNWPARAGSATAVLAGGQTAPVTLDREGLARLLRLSAGVVRLVEREDPLPNDGIGRRAVPVRALRGDERHRRARGRRPLV
jgi:hypothetical protein